MVLLIIMLGAIYTHYALSDKFDRMAPGIIFSLLLFTRLIISRHVSYLSSGYIADEPAQSPAKPDRSQVASTAESKTSRAKKKD